MEDNTAPYAPACVSLPRTDERRNDPEESNILGKPHQSDGDTIRKFQEEFRSNIIEASFDISEATLSGHLGRFHDEIKLYLNISRLESDEEQRDLLEIIHKSLGRLLRSAKRFQSYYGRAINLFNVPSPTQKPCNNIQDYQTCNSTKSPNGPDKTEQEQKQPPKKSMRLDNTVKLTATSKQ